MTATRKPFNAGLPQGFVRFGTRHEAILKMLHAFGDMTYTQMMEELSLDCRRRAYAALLQLEKAGFIFRVTKVGGHGSAERAAMLWSLTKRRVREAYTRDTGAERSTRYRARKAGRAVSSVWAYAATFGAAA